MKPGAMKKVSARWDAAELAACRRGQTVGVHPRGGVTLIARDLIQDEIGATIYAPTDVSQEIVQGNVWIRKDLHLDDPTARGAELCICADPLDSEEGTRELVVTFNGRRLRYHYVRTFPRPFTGTFPRGTFKKGDPDYRMNGKSFRQYWEGDWHRIKVSPKLLRKGTNTVVVRAPAGGRFQFLIEPSRAPNRSAVSRDGGRTWSYDRLSQAGDIDGEYIVRLSLDRHPATGWVEGGSVDLWPRVDGVAVARPARIRRVKLGVDAVRPPGTRARVQARVGSTPVYDPATWTAWASVAELNRHLAAKHRFLQWRAGLSASKDHRRAPRLTGVHVTATVEPKRAAAATLLACRIDQPPVVRPSHPFVHARNTERLRLLRDDCKLDRIVRGKPRGVAQLAALNAWVDGLKLRNKGGRLKIETPWDGLLFWHNARTELTNRMCTHRAAFFVQCATSLGYPARVVIWSHCITEAWAEDVGKWVAFDQSGGFHFEIDGVPAGVLDMASLWDGRMRGKCRGVVRKVYVTGDRRPAKPHDPYPDDDIRHVMWFTRFFVPLRSNFIETSEPHEHAHGKFAFKYDGHLRWLHPEREPLPWFAFTTSRPEDFWFTVDAVNVHLAEGRSGAVDVALEASGPNVARYEARFDGGDWRTVEAAFAWPLSPGANVLEVRTVNTFDVPGRPARVEVEARSGN